MFISALAHATSISQSVPALPALLPAIWHVESAPRPLGSQRCGMPLRRFPGFAQRFAWNRRSFLKSGTRDVNESIETYNWACGTILSRSYLIIPTMHIIIRIHINIKTSHSQKVYKKLKDSIFTIPSNSNMKETISKIATNRMIIPNLCACIHVTFSIWDIGRLKNKHM